MQWLMPWVAIWLIYLTLRTEEVSNQKCQMSTGEENTHTHTHTHKSAFSRKTARRGATRKERKLVDNNFSILVKHPRTGAPLTLAPAKAKWNPRVLPSGG